MTTASLLEVSSNVHLDFHWGQILNEVETFASTIVAVESQSLETIHPGTLNHCKPHGMSAYTADFKMEI